MTEDIETSIQQPTADESPTAAGPEPVASGASLHEPVPGSPAPGAAAGGSSLQERAAAIADERPEAALGAAFAGGLLLALILKRIAR